MYQHNSESKISLWAWNQIHTYPSGERDGVLFENIIIIRSYVFESLSQDMLKSDKLFQELLCIKNE